jgi:hypothetical protein
LVTWKVLGVLYVRKRKVFFDLGFCSYFGALQDAAGRKIFCNLPYARNILNAVSIV